MASCNTSLKQNNEWVIHVVCVLRGLIVLPVVVPIQGRTVKPTSMTASHHRVWTAALVPTWSAVTAARVRLSSLVALVPRRTVSPTTRVVTAPHVTAPGCAAVVLASSALTAPLICVEWSPVIMEDHVSTARVSVLSASPGQRVMLLSVTWSSAWYKKIKAAYYLTTWL